MPSPLYSGAAAIMLGTMASRPDLGWSYFEKLKAADTVAVRGNGAVLTAVANGEKSYGILVDFMAFNAKAKGFADRLRLSGRRQPGGDRARGDPQDHTKRRGARGRSSISSCPTRARSSRCRWVTFRRRRARAPPAWLPAGTRINIMPTDIAKVADANSANLKRFAELFGN